MNRACTREGQSAHPRRARVAAAHGVHTDHPRLPRARRRCVRRGTSHGVVDIRTGRAARRRRGATGSSRHPGRRLDRQQPQEGQRPSAPDLRIATTGPPAAVRRPARQGARPAVARLRSRSVQVVARAGHRGQRDRRVRVDRHHRCGCEGRPEAEHDGPQRRRPRRSHEDGRIVDVDGAARDRPAVQRRRAAAERSDGRCVGTRSGGDEPAVARSGRARQAGRRTRHARVAEPDAVRVGRTGRQRYIGNRSAVR